MSTTPETTLIECILHRAGGSKVTLGETTYHFIDDGHGRQIAPVENQDHVDRFLDIPEGYRRPKGLAAPAQAPVSMGAQVESLTVQTLKVGEALPLADKDAEPVPGQTETTQAGTDAPAGPDTTKDATPPASDAPKGDTALDDMEADQLRTTFEAELGRKPHPASKDETMRAQIQAARDEKAGAA